MHDVTASEAAETSGADACTRCGMCLQSCPTYRVLGAEPDSPRGRIDLMRRVWAGDGHFRPSLAEHIYACLGCRACETACPSGVPYGSLLEQARHDVEVDDGGDPRRSGWRLFRAIAFQVVLPRRLLFKAAMWPARALGAMPWLVRALAAMPVGARARSGLRMLPRSTPRWSPRAAAAGSAATTSTAALFTGCVMGELFGGVHAALERLLVKTGCAVVAPADQWCCGALNVHAGETHDARAMARRNIDAFERCGADRVVVDAAGCGAHLKSYGELLRGDPRYASRAAAFAAKVRDATEFLATRWTAEVRAARRERVAYYDACHLLHAQRIASAPRALLRSVAGLETVELDGAGRCCGAAGVYSLTHPDLSTRIVDDALARIEASGATLVAVTNPGCHMQLLAASARAPRPFRVAHVVEILDEAASASAAV